MNEDNLLIQKANKNVENQPSTHGNLIEANNLNQKISSHSESDLKDKSLECIENISTKNISIESDISINNEKNIEINDIKEDVLNDFNKPNDNEITKQDIKAEIIEDSAISIEIVSICVLKFFKRFFKIMNGKFQMKSSIEK